jgi:hypothetical protein
MDIPRLTLAISLLFLASPDARGGLIDKRGQLEAQDFWVNRDFEWFENNIPFFDCPDEEINTTYEYRWELVTRPCISHNNNEGRNLYPDLAGLPAAGLPARFFDEDGLGSLTLIEPPPRAART